MGHGHLAADQSADHAGPVDVCRGGRGAQAARGASCADGGRTGGGLRPRPRGKGHCANGLTITDAVTWFDLLEIAGGRPGSWARQKKRGERISVMLNLQEGFDPTWTHTPLLKKGGWWIRIVRGNLDPALDPLGRTKTPYKSSTYETFDPGSFCWVQRFWTGSRVHLDPVARWVQILLESDL